ncbi:MAG: hypothetical protein JF588_11510 [Caulobacterales bacterium]|nr:hypothetical protein [Caulobacterales bacterium]
MTTPTFTAPPTAPQRSDAPATFVTRANAFIAWFATLYAELVIAIGWIADQVTAMVGYVASALASANSASASATAAVNATTLIATSTSSVSPSAGAKSLAWAEASRTFANGKAYQLIYRPDPTIRLTGVSSAVDNTAKTMTLTVGASGFAGSGGPYTDWYLLDASLAALFAAVAADVLAAVSALAGVTPKALKDALAPYALTDAATVTPDGHNGLDFTWTIGGNRTLGAITNTYPGATGAIQITQDGTGSRLLAVAGAWKRDGGLAVLSTAAGAVDELTYRVKTVDGSGTATRIVYDIARAPT